MRPFRSLTHRVVSVGAAAGITLMASVPLMSGSASAAAGVTGFDQCQNGAQGNPPTLVACAGAAWANGNSNGNNSHWAEGEFIPYRVALSGLAAGSHDLEITYRPGDSGAHAIDYLGSFGATETTSGTATALHQNHSDPCSDITMGAGWCTPGAPVATIPVSAPDFAGADAAHCGTAGTFAGSQVPGDLALFGPSGSAMTGFTYLSQNVAHGAGCDTTVDIAFSVPVDLGSNNIVIAWAGHIASAQDWGTGNSASAVNGSPYHMSLDSVDGAVTGSTDRSLKTDAIASVPSDPGPGNPAATPSIATVVKDGTTTQPWSGDETTGATAFDTSAISGTDGPVPTGTATYTLFDNGSCQGTGTTETVTLVDGVPPDASTTGPLAAGDYSYDAVYNGDADYNPSAMSACEPFTVERAPTSVSNIVFSDQTGAAWSGTETAGGKANDTATLGGAVPGFVPTGTVTYSYFANGTCGGTPAWTDTVSLTGAGTIPDSHPTDALGAGTYSFDAVYNGDTNYGASGDSACAAFVVIPVTNVGPTLDPSGNGESNGNGNGGNTAGKPGGPGSGAGDPAPVTGVAPAALSQAGTPAAAAMPAGPVTRPGLAWTGADIGLTASLAAGLLALGSLLVVASRRRGNEATA